MSYYERATVTLEHGDCIEVMATFEPESIDAIVTDPPYGLEFMGKEWDRLAGTPGYNERGRITNRPDAQVPYGRGGGVNSYQAGRPMQEWHEAWAREAFRVAKPGAHLLAFGGTRTYHRLAAAIEDAGWEIRDTLVWAYASGFPKSLDVSKAIDKVNGETGRLHKFTAWMRTTGITASELDAVTGTNMGGHYLTAASQPAIPTAVLWAVIRPLITVPIPEWVDSLVDRIEAEREIIRERTMVQGGGSALELRMGELREVRADITAPATDLAREWQGWGTALKPAWEPIVLARKPLRGTVAGNVTEYGTGALNIDGCRIGTVPRTTHKRGNVTGDGDNMVTYQGSPGPGYESAGAAARWPANVILTDPLFDGDTPGVVGGGEARAAGEYPSTYVNARGYGDHGSVQGPLYGDSGTYSRFFLIPKAARLDREPAGSSGDNRVNTHPTVKPTALFSHLIRLVTPPGGVVLDPFVGSGSMLKAALGDGVRAIGIEREEESCRIVVARLGAEPEPGSPKASKRGPKIKPAPGQARLFE